jgi:cation transport ATPase
MRAWVNGCLHVHVCARMCVCVSVCVRVCICVYEVSRYRSYVVVAVVVAVGKLLEMYRNQQTSSFTRRSFSISFVSVGRVKVNGIL